MIKQDLRIGKCKKFQIYFIYLGNCLNQNLPIDFVRLPHYLIFVVSSFLKYFFKNLITIPSIRKIDEPIPTIKIIVL